MTVPFLSGRRRSRALPEDRRGPTGLAIETHAMTCPLDLALTLADQKMRGLFELPEPTAALVVVTNLSDSPLSGHHRDLLWAAFGLPTFEQLRARGKIIARECEVHEGLHVVDRTEMPEHAEVISGHCDCGNEMPRFRAVVPVPKRRSAVA